MIPRLSVAVMAHPSRRACVADLVAQLDRPAEVVWDRHNDRHDTGTRSLEAHDPDATHHLVIQDDAVPCADLLAGAERALMWVPPLHPVSLYLGRVRPFARSVEYAAGVANAEPTSWIVMPDLNWGVAAIIPTPHIAPMLDWYRHQTIKNYDRRMSVWLAGQGFPTWYTWPSLVDHRDEPSLVPGHGQRRHAHEFIGADRSALDVDWTRRVVRLNTQRVTEMTTAARPKRRRRRQP